MVVYTWKNQQPNRNSLWSNHLCKYYNLIKEYLPGRSEEQTKNSVRALSGRCQDEVTGRQAILEVRDPLTPLTSNRKHLPAIFWSPRHVEPGDTSRLNGAMQVLQMINCRQMTKTSLEFYERKAFFGGRYFHHTGLVSLVLTAAPWYRWGTPPAWMHQRKVAEKTSYKGYQSKEEIYAVHN